LARSKLAALGDIHRAVAGHLDRRSLSTAMTGTEHVIDGGAVPTV
jgi:hypothetical protein